LVFYFLCELAIGGEFGTADRHLNRRRRTETHHAAHDVTWLEREAYVGQLLSELFAQAFLECFDADRRAAFQLNLNHPFLRAAVPKVNQVNGVTRSVDPDEAESDFHTLRPDFVLDYVQSLHRTAIGAIHIGAVGTETA